MSDLAASPAIRRYRFAEVELDLARVRLCVDGQPCPCSRKVFELLAALCRSGDRVVTRDELIRALWPGGQLVSDESLTQVIFRARAVLGCHADLIRTVRGIGLRIDAPVQALADQAAEPEEETTVPVPHPAPAPEEEQEPLSQTAPPAPARRYWLIPALVVLLSLLAVGWLLRPANEPSPTVVDEGYGLHEGDLHATLPDTAPLLREALWNESHGERERAAALLEAIHRADAGTPLPAIYRAIWANGSADYEAGRHWLAQARERAAETDGLYLPLLLAYVDAELDASPERVISTAGALLDLRPEAWRMHHARAHLMEFRSMRAAALHELQQIQIPALGHNKRDMTIADRASMGDVAGAQAILDRLPATQDPLMHAFLSGRVAWSRGDFAAAHASFEAVADQSYDIARLDVHVRALIYAGALDVLAGRDALALARIERARTLRGGNNRIDEIDLSLFLAELHAVAGLREAMQAELARALATPSQGAGDTTSIVAHLAAWRLQGHAPPEPADLNTESRALWRAAAAFAASDPDTARTALAQAQQQGVHSGRLSDEARWLELRLGLPVTAQSLLDPPFPPLARVVLRREIRRELAARGADGSPEQP